MLTVELLPEAGGKKQLDYLLEIDNTLIYVNPDFIRLVCRHLDAEPGWLIAKRGENTVGLLPYIKKNGPLGPVFNSMAYYGGNGAVIQDKFDSEAKTALIDEFFIQADAAGASSATIISNPLAQDASFYEDNLKYDYRDERIGQITHFPAKGDPDTLLEIFQNPRPRNIRRAIKEGVEVSRRNDNSALEFLFKTHINNMQAIGGLAKAWTFFERIKYEIHEDDWAVYVASLNGKPIAALLLFYFNQTVEYFTPVIVEEYRNTQALVLTIYKAMQDAMRSEYKNWNWGGTWLSQGGVRDFKKRWGTSEYNYYYFTRIYNPKLITYKPTYLLEHYSGFYLIPFSKLSNHKG
jgi:hypothetical protein